METVKNALAMAETRKFTEVVKELTKRTNNGEINWEEYDPEEGEDIPPPDKATEGYRTEYQGRELRVFKYHERMEIPEAAKIADPNSPDFYWEDKTVLKLVHPGTNGEWVFPDMSITDDLHSSAKQESAGVQEWMERVLRSEE